MGPQVLRLPNGITVVCESRPGAEKVAMQIRFRRAAIHGPADEAGLTCLTQEACGVGTATRTRDQIAEELEAAGTGYESTTNNACTYYGAEALAKSVPQVFGIFSDTLLNPAFAPGEIDKVREESKASLDARMQNPRNAAVTAFFEGAFAGQAAGMPSMGTKDLIDSFTIDQIKARHADLLASPQDIVVSFAGDIDMKTAQDLVERHFGHLTQKVPPLQTPVLTPTQGDTRVANDNSQLNLFFGFKAPPASGHERFAAQVLQNLLSGGMSAPLFTEIREKRGLVYSVAAGYTPVGMNNSLFYITAGTGRGNAGELIKVSFDILGDAARNGFTDDQIRVAVERLMRSVESDEESAYKVCERNANQIMNRGRIIPNEETRASLSRVTSADVQALCARMLAGGKYVLSAVGPQDTMPTPDEIKGLMQAQAATIPAAILNYRIPAPAQAQGSFNAAAKAFAKGDAEMTTLPNGLRVVTIERPGSLACGGWVGVGSASETPDINGITHAIEHMMFKGTKSFKPGELDWIVENELAGDLNAYTSKDQTAYYFYDLDASGLDRVMDICGEMIFDASLPHDAWEGHSDPATGARAKGERDVILEEVKMYSDKPESRAHDTLDSIMYAGQAQGRHILGTPDTLVPMTVADQRKYRDAFYTPNNVILCAAGPVKHADFVALCEKKFSHLKPGEVPSIPPQTYHGGTKVVEMDEARRCTLALGLPAVDAGHPDLYVFEAIEKILCAGASSRLYKAIVTKAGLGPGIGGGVTAYRHLGNFGIYGSFSAQNIKPALAAIFAEMRGLADNVNQAELDKAKAKLQMELLGSSESNRGACRMAAAGLSRVGRIVTQSEIISRMEKVTIDDVKRVTRQLLAANPSLAMVVPAGTDKALIPTHAEMLAMRDGPKAAANQTHACKAPGTKHTCSCQ